MDANKTAGEELDGNYTRMLTSNLKQVLAQHPRRQPTVRPPASLSRKLFKLDEQDTQDTAGEARTKLVRDVLIWTPTHGQAKAGRPARTYIQQLCEDTDVTRRLAGGDER